MTMKEKMNQAKENAKAKKAVKEAAKIREQEEFDALPVNEKEEIRNFRSVRTAIWVLTGVAAAGIVVAGAAAVVEAKAAKDAARGSVISDVEIDAISAKYQ